MFMDIADGNALHVGVIQKGAHHANASIAHSDVCHRDSLAGSGSISGPECRCRNDRGKSYAGSNGGSGSGENLSARLLHEKSLPSTKAP
jgi:hypothetical protein